MSNQIEAKKVTDITIITPEELALIKNDLSGLNPQQRLSLYKNTCESLGLNHLTQPFGYIEFRGGKLSLYALKNCTDQLRQIHGISIEIVSKSKIDDLYVVVARASHPSGRVDEDMGTVSVAGLKGDALANAMLKAITKAKRRVTLSICGLGILDETEIETIHDAKIKIDEVNFDDKLKIEAPKEDIKEETKKEEVKEEVKTELKKDADDIPATLGQFQKIKELREILGLTQQHIASAYALIFGLDDPKKMSYKNAVVILNMLKNSKSAEDFGLEIQKHLD